MNASITSSPQEQLCFQCHTKEDPNTAGGTSPYRAFNVADNLYGDHGTAVRFGRNDAEPCENVSLVGCFIRDSAAHGIEIFAGNEGIVIESCEFFIGSKS